MSVRTKPWPYLTEVVQVPETSDDLLAWIAWMRENLALDLAAVVLGT
jgi:hypothetical protein